MQTILYQEFCPCCCGPNKSRFPQLQEEIIEVKHLKTGECYGHLEYECQRSGQRWQTPDQEAGTALSKKEAIDAALAARGRVAKPWLRLG